MDMLSIYQRFCFELSSLMLIVLLYGLAASPLSCTRKLVNHSILEATAQGDMGFTQLPKEPFDKILRERCGVPMVMPIAGASFLRPPYQQAVTPTQTTLVWTSTADNFSLKLSASDGSVQSITPHIDTSAPLPVGKQWVAALSQLKPGNIYCYEISSGDTRLFVGGGIAVAPAADSAAVIQFVALGDSGKTSPGQIALATQMAKVPFDFALFAGDVAYEHGKLTDFERYVFPIYGPMMAQRPFFPASGNHDYHTQDATPFRQVFVLPTNGGSTDGVPNGEGGERWYSYDWGSLHLVVLDTEKIAEPQRLWLEKDLQTNSLPWTVVLAHRPPYSAGAHGSNRHVRALFTPLFEKHGVQLALFGHEHNYERTQSINGVTYIVTGAGGKSTRQVGKESFTAHSQSVFHFVHVTIAANTLTLVAIDSTGNAFDSVQLTRSPQSPKL